MLECKLGFTVPAIAMLVACTVGEVDETFVPPDSDNPDMTDSGDPGTDPGTPRLACDELVAVTDNGKHKEGEPCLKCHNPAARDAPAFTIGGTLYIDDAGTGPLVGATIHLIDATGKDITMVSAQNGNFWTEEPVAFPVETYGSLCPEVREMITPVTERDGDCNTAGCHDNTFRISLP